MKAESSCGALSPLEGGLPAPSRHLTSGPELSFAGLRSLRVHSCFLASNRLVINVLLSQVSLPSRVLWAPPFVANFVFKEA